MIPLYLFRAATACLFVFFALCMSGCTRPQPTELPAVAAEPVLVASQEDTLVANRMPKGLKGKKCIVLDPGHGGEDRGAKSTTKPVLLEKNLNLTTARFVQTYLSQMGFQAVLTRSSDRFLTLKQRSDFANASTCDLFVSIHYNSAPNPEAHGIEVFYYQPREDNERMTASKGLAAAILERVIDNTGAKSRKVKPGNLAVIRETTMPAVLIECGFLTNEAETQKMRDESYLRRLAWGIAQGIQTYGKRS